MTAQTHPYKGYALTVNARVNLLRLETKDKTLRLKTLPDTKDVTSKVRKMVEAGTLKSQNLRFRQHGGKWQLGHVSQTKTTIWLFEVEDIQHDPTEAQFEKLFVTPVLKAVEQAKQSLAKAMQRDDILVGQSIQLTDVLNKHQINAFTSQIKQQ